MIILQKRPIIIGNIELRNVSKYGRKYVISLEMTDVLGTYIKSGDENGFGSNLLNLNISNVKFVSANNQA